MDIWLLAAGVLSLFILVVHVFGGGRTVAAPLLAAQDLEDVPKYINYYCWHLVSISMTLMGAAFLWSGFVTTAWEAGALGTASASGFCIWGIALVKLKKKRFQDMPQGWLFLPVAALGVIGLLG